MKDDRVYRFWLHNLPGVGDKTIERLLTCFGSPGEIYHASPEAMEKALGHAKAFKVTEFRKNFLLWEAYEEMLSKNISFYTREDEEYPVRLKNLSRPPYGIYCLGKLPENQRTAAAVIGARECSEYGSTMARAFAGKLAGAGVNIISGMARGIDGIGQKAALMGGGRTYAVLGCGVDVCYPASNRRLYEEILARGGGILSVFPPGTKPLRQHFPERNRIVAGLSDLVLVVEARQKSGTWITVDMALEQGKSVYAIPGRLTDRLNDGCNLLIRQGAGIALSPEDLLAELVLLENRDSGGHVRKMPEAEETGEDAKADFVEAEEEILRFLDYYPKSADEILESAHRAGIKMELSQLLNKLIELCMEGLAGQTTGNYFVRKEYCKGERE